MTDPENSTKRPNDPDESATESSGGTPTAPTSSVRHIVKPRRMPAHAAGGRIQVSGEGAAGADRVEPLPSSALARVLEIPSHLQGIQNGEELDELGFSMFLLTYGDLRSVAIHLGVDRKVVHQLAVDGKWFARAARLAHVVSLRPDGTPDLRPSDFEEAHRVRSKSCGYVQGHRLRILAERVLTDLLRESSLVDRLTETNAETGSERINLRPLTDLSRVITMANSLCADALGSTGKDPGTFAKPARGALPESEDDDLLEAMGKLSGGSES